MAKARTAVAGDDEDPLAASAAVMAEAGFTPDETVAAVEALREPLDMRSRPADEVVQALTAERVVRGHGSDRGALVVLVDLGSPTDQVVVEDHAYEGEPAGRSWRFTARSLEMACRVAGWSTVEWLSTDPARLRLS